MTDADLQRLAERLSLDYFGLPLRHPIVFNARLRTTGGRYHLRDHHIDINPKMLTEFDEQTLKGVILHELCHYHLHLAGRGHQHRDADFKALLAQVGGLRYAPATSARKQALQQPKYGYQCQSCGAWVYRRRRFNVNRYVCRRCGGRFVLKKIREN